MTLTTIKQLDQKNRLHLPTMYMSLVNIPTNSFVTVEVNTVTNEITIKAIPDEDFQKIKEELLK